MLSVQLRELLLRRACGCIFAIITADMNDEYEWPEGNEYPDGGDMARIISGFTMKGLSLAINSFKKTDCP
ncbi:MAG: hypothetical protein L6V87_08670 [Ruminococcus sp.]|nr:MAG: hypothetical protein L6V87_08670 [Ruminococcus sp.]